MFKLRSQVTVVTGAKACSVQLLASVSSRFSVGVTLIRSHRSEFMHLHIHPPASEPDTFSFEPQSLLDRRVTPQLNLPARSQYTLPGKSIAPSQHARYDPRGTGITRDLRNAAIS